ncbi:MAG TPA: YIP1 family protein [Gemmatimonadaceae bacterium]|nr:YIP1 family protein [Gemmatimonadaceae bacterium]
MSDPVANPPVASAPAAKTSTWEDVLDVFYAPREVFERRRDGRYLVPLLISCLITIAVFYLSQGMNETLQEAEFQRVIRESKMTAEQAAMTKAMGKKFSALAIYLVPAFVAIAAWLGGLMVMLLGNMMGGKMKYAQGTAIAVLASMPELLGRIVAGVQALFLDTSTATHRYSYSLSAARFMPGDTNNWLLKLGALADPFVIWGIVLIGMGAWIIGRMEKEKAAVLAIIVALISAALFR